MFIDVVGQGESLETVAARNGVSAEQLVTLNNLTGRQVTQGQALLIPATRYTVRPGDDLWEISTRTGVPLPVLQRYNPGASSALRVGQVLRIPPAPKAAAEVIGYLPVTDPGVNADDIAPWGPNLTYVAIFSHLIDEEGNMPPIDDTAAIAATYAAGAQPLMSIANMRAGGAFSPEIARAIITQPEVRERVMTNILQTVQEKGYAGVDSDIENIDESERAGYVDFLRELKARLGDRILNVAVPPKWDEGTFAYARGHDYAGIGRVADRVYLMNYEFSWVGGPPGAIAPFPSTRRVLLYAASLIPKAKILNGLSTTAYNWTLPDTPENRATALSHQAALNLAIESGVPIRYDENARTPWFRYTEGGQEHEVWFGDARSIMASLRLIRETGVGGTGIWHLGAFSPQLPPLLSYLFNVKRS